MKNKLKRLQLTIRNYHKKGLIFGTAFVLMISSLSILIPKLNTHADPGDEIITSANANVIAPIDGANPSSDVSSSDGAKYSVAFSTWYLSEGPDYPYLTETDSFEIHKDYTVRVIFTPNEGFAFDENTIFTINSGETSSWGADGYRQRTFQDTPDSEGETEYTITYDLNGGLAGGESTITEQSGSVGMDLSEDNLITRLGVSAPEDKVLNYITIDDEPFNINDGFFLDRSITIKYFWRDDTTTMYTIDFDINGGTAIDYDVPPVVPAGQAFVLNAPDESQVTPPEDKEFDAFEVNGERVEAGTLITVNNNSSVKLLWKDVETIYYTVQYDDGNVLSAEDKLLNQSVEAGGWAPEPENAAGETITSIVTEVGGKYYYNDYELLGFYTDPDFTTPFNGGPITENTIVYLEWYDTLEDYEQITEVNLTVTPPEAGTEITMEDEEDWDTQGPELSVALPDDAQYNLWTDSEEENYSYWLKEKSRSSEPFTGVIEKGGKYYAEIWLRTNEPGEVIFARDVVVKVNGVAIPAEDISYDVDALVALVEIEIEDSTATPNTGVFTAEGSSAAVATSAAIVLVILSIPALAVIKRRK